jgi:hypothetical protein
MCARGAGISGFLAPGGKTEQSPGPGPGGRQNDGHERLGHVYRCAAAGAAAFRSHRRDQLSVLIIILLVAPLLLAKDNHCTLTRFALKKVLVLVVDWVSPSPVNDHDNTHCSISYRRVQEQWTNRTAYPSQVSYRQSCFALLVLGRGIQLVTS